MKTTLLITASAALVAGSLGFSALADDVKASPKTEKAAAAAKSTTKVGKALDGKLIRLKDGKVADSSLGNPKQIIFYHSASW